MDTYNEHSDFTVQLWNSKGVRLSKGEYKTIDDALMCASHLVRTHDVVDGMGLVIKQHSTNHVLSFEVQGGLWVITAPIPVQTP